MKQPPQSNTGNTARNEPCPCQSGKKYKACCLNKPAAPALQNSLADALKQAWQAVGQKDLMAAAHWFQEAVNRQPDHPEALAGLGQALCWQRRMSEGLGYLQKAAEQLVNTQSKRDIRFVLELAEQLHHWGDLETSLQLTELALLLEPNHPVALNNHALYLVRLNRFEDALPFARQVCALQPQDPTFQNTLAIVETRLGDLTNAQSRFEKVIQANLQPQQTARAQQELVSVLDRLGRYDEAFSTCLKAKAHERQQAKFARLDKQHVFRTIANNKTGYPAGLLTRWSVEDFADALPTPVFLMGFLRSGTTLTEQILSAHPDIISSDENDLIYEDTVNDLQSSMSKVFDLLSLPWSEEINTFHEKAKSRYIATPSFADVSQPIYNRSVARWRHYQKHVQTIQSVLAPYIQAFGYQDD